MYASTPLTGLLSLTAVHGAVAASMPAHDVDTPLHILKRTLEPATSNTKGKCPVKANCTATKISKAIQAAECSHNTRTSGKQTFAVFVTDHQYDQSHGAPYGTCSAYTCAAPTKAQMTKADDDCWTFFWDAGGQMGESSGEGAGCIKSPQDGSCGCENSDGIFVPGETNCT